MNKTKRILMAEQIERAANDELKKTSLSIEQRQKQKKITENILQKIKAEREA